MLPTRNGEGKHRNGEMTKYDLRNCPGVNYPKMRLADEWPKADDGLPLSEEIQRASLLIQVLQDAESLCH